MEEKQLFGALTVYRERGAYLRRLEQFDKAKEAYDEAELAKPDDVRTLVGKSRVCADAMQPAQAYSDAERASKLEPSNMIAKNMKAQAMYEMGEFERSVVYNYRGQRIRRMPPYFTNGVNQGTETIQDCVGENAGNALQDMLPLIRRAEASRASGDAFTTRAKRVSRIPVAAEKKKLTSIETRRRVTLARVLAMKYLGRMASDKFYLRERLGDPRLDSANARGSRELGRLVHSAYSALKERQSTLRTRRPYYTVKLAEAKDSQRMREYRARVLATEREIGAHAIETMLHKCEKHLESTNIRELIYQAERMQTFLDTKNEINLPEKEQYIDRLYRIVGEAYLSQNRLSYEMSEGANSRRVRFLMGLPVGRPTHFDSVLTNYPYKFREIKHATELVQASLEAAEVPMARCWLLHEMARLLVQQKNYALAKFYAKRCQREAEIVGSHAWWLNACLVLMSGEMQQGNVNEVRLAVDEALDYARPLIGTEQLVSFLEKCGELAGAATGGDERRAIQQREREILSVMEEQQRVETEVLFKRMSTVPPGRRFSVLPLPPAKLSPAEAARSERRLRQQPGLTVVPGAPVAMPAPPISTVPGLQTFDL